MGPTLSMPIPTSKLCWWPSHRAHFPKTRPIVLKEVVDRITSGKFFGLVECDISVPDELKEKFSEMTPVFKNVEVSRQQLGPRMTAFADGKHFLERPSRMLIGSMFGEKVLLLSTLARWYLSHGLIITKVYQLIEYSPRAAFRSFGESVSNARRSGDKDPDQELLATTSKLIGNSSYGKTITDKTRHRDVSFVSGDREAAIAVRSNLFASMDELDDQFYEVVKFKKKVSTGAVDVAGYGDVDAPTLFLPKRIFGGCKPKRTSPRSKPSTFAGDVDVTRAVRVPRPLVHHFTNDCSCMHPMYPSDVRVDVADSVGGVGAPDSLSNPLTSPCIFSD